MNTSNEHNIPHSGLASHYMLRPRLNELFGQAVCGRLVYVIGGVGYGKTQAVRQYIEQQPDAAVRWMQLTESDNVGSHLWERFAHVVSLENPMLAAKLHKLGFPATLARFKQFAELLRNTEDRPQNVFFVLDDFQLIHSKETLTFVERCVYMKVTGICIVLLSKEEPELSVDSLHSKGKIVVIREDALRFTPEETAAFFRLHDISLSAQDLSQVLEVTKGWALALNMLAVTLKRKPNTLKYALSTMTQGLFQLLEAEAWAEFPERTQKTMAKVSLLPDLPILPIEEISDDVNFLENTPGLVSFVWFNRFTNDFKIHPLYLEFLQSKQHILSCEERLDMYRQVAEWCAAHDLYMDAMHYHAKARQFERMVQLFLSLPFKLSQDSSKYFLDILENLAPNEAEREDVNVLFLQNYFTSLLLAGANRYEAAQEHALAVIRAWENVDTPLATIFLHTSYSVLAYLDLYICTVTHQYKGPAYLKKSLEYDTQSFQTPTKVGKAFINADVRSFACVVGVGAKLCAFDQFLEAAWETDLYTRETPLNIFSGYADLIACEYAFFKNQPDLARRYAEKAILQAQEHKQYSIAAMAKNYLLQLAVIEGDAALAKVILKQLGSSLDNLDFWNRQLYYDLYVGGFYAQLGMFEMIPYWLSMDEKEAAMEIHIPARELHIHALYYIASKQYTQALMILCSSYPRDPYERFLFGELRFALLTAVARIRTGDVEGALEEFVRAYEMSFCGVFELFFIELGKELPPLLTAALQEADCGIPEKWLKMIGRKASIYTKKATVVADVFREETQMKETVSLSEREMKVLIDLYHGLSREEIAENQHLSINTVKKALQLIYTKLGACNGVDAIRIALEQKIVK